MKKEKRSTISIYDICLMGMMVAVIEVCKAAFTFLPNIELTSFWLIMFTLFFGWKIVFVVPVFILLEGTIYGFGTWWIMYLYVWPLLVFIARLARKQESVWFWSIISGAFGLAYGFLCSFVYVVIGVGEGGIADGIYAGFTWWVAGIPWDIVHGVGNFVVMMVLYKPVRGVLMKVKKIGAVQ